MILYPKKYIKNATQFTLNMVKENGIKGIILDVDNTLIDYYKNMPAGTEQWCKTLQNEGIKFCIASNSNKKEKIEQVAKEQKVEYIKGDILCNECFDLYLPDKDALIKRAPKEVNLLVSEMETFALFYNAKRENKKATCLLTVVDVPKEAKGLTPEERETALNQMINLALETIIKD